MIKFIDKRTREVKEAFSIRSDENKTYIKFKSSGTEYGYNKNNIELLSEPINNISDSQIGSCKFDKNSKEKFITYCYEHECYKCHKKNHILTYIIFDDGSKESLVFPWDKQRLLKHQNIWAHMQDSSIEYYGLKTIGRFPEFDEIMLKKYPGRIAVKFSQQLKAPSTMNLCEHCGAGQGQNFVYRSVNKFIQKKISLDIVK